MMSRMSNQDMSNVQGRPPKIDYSAHLGFLERFGTLVPEVVEEVVKVENSTVEKDEAVEEMIGGHQTGRVK